MNVNQKLEKCTNEIELKNTISNEECTRILDSEGEGQGGRIWENGIETRIISYKKRISRLGLMQHAGYLGRVHWDDPERWYREGGGRGVQEWEHVYTRGGFMLMYGKTNTVL